MSLTDCGAIGCFRGNFGKECQVHGFGKVKGPLLLEMRFSVQLSSDFNTDAIVCNGGSCYVCLFG